MERYIVMELQIDADGKTATLTNTFGELNLAKQKYFTILAAASVSELPVHGAVILDVLDTTSRMGGLVVEQCVFYEDEPEPEQA